MGYQRRVHGGCRQETCTMKLFLTLCFVALAVGAPAPQEEEMIPEALPYVHEEIAAEPYVHEEIAAEPYEHVEIEAEPYVHEEPAPAPVAAVAPVAYAGYPLTYALPVAAKAVPASTTYAIAAPTYYIAAVKTGCINNVGSVVPCAQ